MEPISEAKIGLKVWKYFGIARDLLEKLRSAPEQISELSRSRSRRGLVFGPRRSLAISMNAEGR